MDMVKTLVKVCVVDCEMVCPIDMLLPEREREGERECIHHRTTSHSTDECYTLWGLFKRRVAEKQLRFSDEDLRFILEP